MYLVPLYYFAVAKAIKSRVYTLFINLFRLLTVFGFTPPASSPVPAVRASIPGIRELMRLWYPVGAIRFR